MSHEREVDPCRHYGLTVHTCVPFDPESKGGSEATVRIAKADTLEGLVADDLWALPTYQEMLYIL